MKYLNLILLICCLNTFSYAQQNLSKNYDPLSSNGNIPVEFINSINAKWQQYQKDNIDAKEKRKTRKDKKDFLLNSSQQLDAVLKSGKVTFNNEVYQYLNKLTDKLLNDNAKLRSEVRIYPISFETSNAFAFNEGALFVQIGIIARAENEAELAFIIGHEIAHYQKKHSIQQHLEVKKAERGEGIYKRTDESDQIKAVRKYSRENESEADRYGYRLFTAAGYNPYAAISSLANLRRTLLPPSGEPFKASLIEKGTYAIPNTYLQPNLKNDEEKKDDDEAKEDEENELSTHPSLDTRIDHFLGELKVNDTINKPYYLFPKKEFEYIRELCRMEMCRIYLLENKIDLAFYHINTMLSHYPENEYLKRMMAITLARLAEASTNASLSKKVMSPNRCADELVVSNTLLRSMNKEEISLLAIRYAWWVKKTSAPSADIDRILKYTITNYTSNYARTLSDFAPRDSFSHKVVDSYYIVDTTASLLPTNKKSKIAKNKSTSRYWFDRSLSRFALSDIKDDPEFSALFNTTLNENPNRKKKLDEEDSDKTNKSVGDVVITQTKKKLTSLNINSMILIEPEYYKLDHRKSKITDAVKNEYAEFQIREMLLKTAEAANFNLTLLAGNNFSENDVQKFTDYGLLKDWLNEFFIEKKRTAIPVDYARIKDITKRYDSKYAAILVNVSEVTSASPGNKILGMLVGIIYFPLLPLAIMNLMPDNNYTMIIGVVDLEESKMVYSNIIKFDTSDSRDLFKSQLYGIYTTLKGKNRKVKGGIAS